MWDYAKNWSCWRLHGAAMRGFPIAGGVPRKIISYLCHPAMMLGEFDEFLEVGIFALGRPKEPDRSRYAQVRNRNLLDGSHFEMGGNKRQTYPGRDESHRPIILVGLIHNTNLYAASGKQIGYVLVEIAPRPHDERFILKIGELDALPRREAVVFWYGQ
jgi:hypothetical protein